MLITVSSEETLMEAPLVLNDKAGFKENIQRGGLL